MKFPVFDLHCDTAWGMVGHDFSGEKCLNRNDLHIDLERAAALPGYCQCFACFTTPLDISRGAASARQMFEKELSAILRQIQVNSHRIRQAFSPEDIENNRKKGIMSAVLTLEGPAGIDFDSDQLEALYAQGFRMTTLGWNEDNPLIGSHLTGGGLTAAGRKYVETAQNLGMLVDVSHCSDRGFWDIMDITRAPVVASHSNSRSVWGHSRNLTDDMFQAICATGGVAGINLYAGFLGDSPNLDTVCDHVLHFLTLDPDGRHIALGGDLDGCEALPDGFTGVESYPALAVKLSRRGVDDNLLQNIFWKNAMGVMENAVRHHKK